MPKRRRDERGGGRNRSKASSRPMHLYLVLDDWSSGYTIRKIDLLIDPVVGAYPDRKIITGGFLGRQRLPPAIMRVEAPRGLPAYLVAVAAASGGGASSKLMFMQPVDPSTTTTKPTALSSTSFFPIADVRLRSIGLGPRPPPHDPVDYPMYIPVVAAAGDGDGDEDWLFALDSRGAFSVLCMCRDHDKSWSWRALPDPLFQRRHVVAYAASPEGGLVFNTKADDDDDDDDAEQEEDNSFTFAIAGAKGEPEWNRRHHIRLPFAGRGHFDAALGAFVGLAAGAPGGSTAAAGHLRLVYMDGSQKLSKEKLFGEGSLMEGRVKLFGEGSAAERQVGSTLVYMGGRSNFCLVECISIDARNVGSIVEAGGSKQLDDADDDQDDDVGEVDDSSKPDDGGQDCFFRLTAFFLKYDKNGDVEIVIVRVLYFNVPEGVTRSALKNPAAFWM